MMGRIFKLSIAYINYSAYLSSVSCKDDGKDI